LWSKASLFLLARRNGSGKTEIYLQALAEAVQTGQKRHRARAGNRLDPANHRRFSARFPGRVAVLHSELKLGERFDEWQRIKKVRSM